MATAKQPTNTPNTPNTPNIPKTTAPALAPLVAGRDLKDFKLTPPMVDVRGWDLMLANGTKAGRIDRIMLDTSEQKPRYLDVKMTERSGHLLLPIGLGTVKADKKQVVLESLKPETLQALPLLQGETITRDFERQLLGAVTGRKVTELTNLQWYADPVFDSSKMLGTAKPVVTS